MQEQLASLLASEQRFVEAVQSREVPAAANLAVEVLKVRGGLPCMPASCVATSDSCVAAACRLRLRAVPAYTRTTGDPRRQAAGARWLRTVALVCPQIC